MKFRGYSFYRGLKFGIPCGVFLWTMIFFFNAFATDYFVKTAGSDSNTGLSDVQAWATVSKVNAQTFVAGDIIYFNKGDSWAEDLSCDSNTIYNSYGTGNSPILNSINCFAARTGVRVYNLTAQVTGRAAMAIQGGSDIIFDGCVFDGTGDTSDHVAFIRGDSTYGWVSDVIIRNTEFKNAGAACGLSIEGYTHNILIENCTAHDNADNNIQIYNNVGGRDVNFAPYDIILRGNTCYNAIHHGIEIGWDANQCVIEQNHCYDNAGAGIGGFQAFNNIIKNNLLINNLEQIVIAQTGSQDNKVYNNTLIAGATTVKGLWFRNTAETGNIYKNNLIYGINQNSPDLLIETTETVEGDYNLIYNVQQLNFLYGATTYTTLASWRTASSQDANSIAQDPLLNDNYSIPTNSPAKDAGVTLTEVIDDFRRLGRPQGAEYDIGAMEFGNLMSFKGLSLSGVNVK